MVIIPTSNTRIFNPNHIIPDSLDRSSWRVAGGKYSKSSIWAAGCEPIYSPSNTPIIPSSVVLPVRVYRYKNTPPYAIASSTDIHILVGWYSSRGCFMVFQPTSCTTPQPTIRSASPRTVPRAGCQPPRPNSSALISKKVTIPPIAPACHADQVSAPLRFPPRRFAMKCRFAAVLPPGYRPPPARDSGQSLHTSSDLCSSVSGATFVRRSLR
jgi:hypothetical protein